MVLEATVICIDNSEHMRNGDFSPSRFEAQQDACNLICGVKTRANAENAVGLVTTAGKSPEVCVSLTQDLGKILSSLHRVQLAGASDIAAAVLVASLALRHRQNKRQEQRIVLFVGSPVAASEAELKKLGAQLKKNKVALDVVNFGESAAEENRLKLEAFVASVNNHDNSHIVTLPPGEHMLSQMLNATPIVRGDAAAAQGEGGMPAGGQALDDFGIDPNVDPELALAMRLSMESAEAERRTREGGASSLPAASGGSVAEGAAPQTGAPLEDAMDLDDDPELRAALALSLQTAQVDAQGPVVPPAPPTTTVEMVDAEDDELQRAIEMSRQTASIEEKGEAPQGRAPASPNADRKVAEDAIDPAFMASVLLNLPGLDPQSQEVQDMLREMQAEEQKKKEEKNDEKKK